MKKIKITDKSLQEVIDSLDIIAKSESILCQSSLIYSDMTIALKTFKEQFKSDSKPREWYFAIREQGTEDGENIEAVIARCNALGEPHVTIKVEYNSTTNSYTMKINLKLV